MSFHVAPLEARECGRHCPDVIVADGVIEAQTPETFVNFLKSGNSDFQAPAHCIFQLARRQCRRFDGLRAHSAGTAHRWRRRAVRCGRRSGPLRWRMPVGLRLRSDGRRAPGRAPWQRGRAASNVYCRDRGRRPFRISREAQFCRSAHGPPCLGATHGAWASTPRLVRRAESLPPDTVHVLTRDEMRRWSLATSQF